MDIDLIAISECLSLYYEVLAIITYQCNTRSCLKVGTLQLEILLHVLFQGSVDLQASPDSLSWLF